MKENTLNTHILTVAFYCIFCYPGAESWLNGGKAMKHPSISVAVIIERLTLDNQWCSEKWEAIGIVPDLSGGNKQ